MDELKPQQVYTKDGKDFRVHFVKDGWVYGIVYDSENRHRFDGNVHPWTLRKCLANGFVTGTQSELVTNAPK